MTTSSLELPFSMRNIIPNRVTQDILQCFRLGYISGFFTDDGNKLTLVIESFYLLGGFWDGDVVEWAG